jgi:hypothetical protein
VYTEAAITLCPGTPVLVAMDIPELHVILVCMLLILYYIL